MKDYFQRRKLIIQSVIVVLSAIFLLKLFDLQVLDPSYKDLAQKNVVKKIKMYPTRGLIYDRYSNLLVYNQAIYDISVVPRQVKEIDTTLFCEIFDITVEDFNRRMDDVSTGLKYYSSNEFLKQVSAEDYAIFREHAYRFEGFYGVPRTIRKYPIPAGAHMLGDVGEVDSATISASNFYYQPRDYVGKSGLELVYENNLRGKRGYRYIFIDKFYNEQGSFDDGKSDSIPEQGSELQLTIDMELQLYGEQLLQNKVGSIVAIEPSTGEILALVTSPSFDPNLLCGRERSTNYKALQGDSLSPLFNRAIMAQYPPGSTFKPFVAAVALQERAIDANFSYSCDRTYHIPGYTLHCSHGHPSARNVMQGIQHSCNPYFWQTFKNSIESSNFNNSEEGYRAWHQYAKNFGLGAPLGIDMISEKPGNIPSAEYYNDLYGRKAWKAVTIISLGIGQGEILVTPLQLANMYAVFANRGYYKTPHIVKTIDGQPLPTVQTIPTGIDKEHFDRIAEGLQLVVDEGTGRRSKIPGLTFGGKTGTAQNPHGEDHSIFAGIAPVQNSKIAVAVIVENAGGGSKYAAPITSLIIEKYLHDTIADSRLLFEKVILDADLTHPVIEEE